jgi:hypothetical protein
MRRMVYLASCMILPIAVQSRVGGLGFEWEDTQAQLCRIWQGFSALVRAVSSCRVVC